MNGITAHTHRADGSINPWVIAMTVMLPTFMEVLDTTIVNVSLPHIAGNLSSGIDESTWVLTSYLVSNAIVLPLTGWFSKLFGRKRFYMTCVALFTASSVLCGLAPNLAALIFFRILQGTGGGALQPISQAVLVESFPREKTGMAMAIYAMGVVLAPIIGPTLGGWITDNYTWRWIFLINLPVGIMALMLSTLFISDPPYLERQTLKQGLKIDYIGLGLICVGLGFLQITLDKGQQEDWFSSRLILWTASIAVIGVLGAVIWELRGRNPIVDLRLLKDRNFGLSTFIVFILGVVLYGSTVLLPILLQTLLGYTAMLSGLVLSPGGIAVLFFSPLVGRLLQKFDARWLVVLGLVIVALSLFRMGQFNLEIDFQTAVMARVLQSVGLAFLFVPINTAAFYFLRKDRINNATGLLNLARNLGGSFGIALVTTLLTRRTQFHQTVLVSHLTPLDRNYRDALSGAAGMLLRKGSDPVQASLQARGLVYGLMQRQAAMLGFIEAFRLMGILFLCMIPLIPLMKKAKASLAAQMH
jgi:DHA2 family multidrug resistance protein